MNTDGLFSPREVVVILGGHDAEMAAAKEMSLKAGVEVIDRNLKWGAKTSQVTTEIEENLSAGKVVVCLEIEDNAGYSEHGDRRFVLIDHHGDQCTKPSMLEQLHAWLKGNVEDHNLPDLTRQQMLIVANDKGGINGLLDMGASMEEAIEIRQEEYKLQGVTEMEIWQAKAAADTSHYNEDLDLNIVKCAHAHCGPITDYLMMRRIEKGVKHEGNVLVLPASPTTCKTDIEVNFFGDGRIVLSLNAKFPDSWIGGGLPKRGFWGTNKGGNVGYAIHDIINEVVSDLMCLNQKRLLEKPCFCEHEEGPFKPTL